VIVSGGYEGSSTNGYVQGYNFCFEMKLELTPCPMPRKMVMKLQHNYFLSATLAQTFNNRSSRIDWCGNYLISQPTDLHSSRRSGSVYSV
jgi:hypothetical protein